MLFPAELGKRRVEIGSKGVDGDTPLHVMAWRNDLFGAELLIDSGADVNAVGDMGETPLHVAVRQKNERLVERMLRAGADPNVRSEFNETAAEAAAKQRGPIKRLFKKQRNT